MKAMMLTVMMLMTLPEWAANARADSDIDAGVVLAPSHADVGMMTRYIYKSQSSGTDDLANPSAAGSYHSFGIGPSIKLGRKVTAYGLVGAAADAQSSAAADVPVQALTLDGDARMYGIGMQIRPQSDWRVDVNYQNANLSDDRQSSRNVNYFHLGVGYTF